MADWLSGMMGGQTGVPNLSPAQLLKFTQLDPHVQKHLARVYLTLALALIACSVGCYIGMLLPFILTPAFILSFGAMLGLAFTPNTPQMLNRRYTLLGTFAFCQGCALTPLVSMAAAYYPGVVLTAMLGTATVFMCFTVSAMITPRRAYMFLGGYLASATLGLLVMSLSSRFTGSGSYTYGIELYGGLLVFAGYVLFDTQVIIEKAYSGNMDHIRHATDLFVDVVALFVRILVILMRNAEKKEQDKRKREKRN